MCREVINVCFKTNYHGCYTFHKIPCVDNLLKQTNQLYCEITHILFTAWVCNHGCPPRGGVTHMLKKRRTCYQWQVKSWSSSKAFHYDNLCSCVVAQIWEPQAYIAAYKCSVAWFLNHTEEDRRSGPPEKKRARLFFFFSRILRKEKKDVPTFFFRWP